MNTRRHILQEDLQGLAELHALSILHNENVFQERLIDLVGTFAPENASQPLETWGHLDPDLRDLIGGMTRLDPRQRITAKEALHHRWIVRSYTTYLSAVSERQVS
ncbi:hypothetical protein ASPCAL08525 [Aspergillus calidoustus]|uniref:Protein kinase domain-containing protein n=1 Tax=Aspergillus calidoustus TaxID=454130 RepID=A0A0U5GQE7_ASPCI|nr:hypothetical protein ASPCAL08525 [Aspergillus calidoustus]